MLILFFLGFVRRAPLERYHPAAVFGQSAELYADIVFSNEERRELLMKFIEHNDRLAQMVKEDDKKGFIKEFEEVMDFFSRFT